MTEEEARTKWCPKVRFHMNMQGLVFDNKPDKKPPEPCDANSTFCIASDCMMWQWDVSVPSEQGRAFGELGSTISTTSGYCGLTK